LTLRVDARCLPEEVSLRVRRDLPVFEEPAAACATIFAARVTGEGRFKRR
jgi:hypothetical protein